MSYASQGLIQAGDYNTVAWGTTNGGTYTSSVNNLAYMYGAGYSRYGYGQSTTPVDPVAIANTVTATQWTNLLNTINLTLTQEGQANIAPTGVAAGATITYYASINTGINTAWTNYGSVNSRSNSTSWGSGQPIATSIVWTGSTYVAAGESGKAATSTDGVTWVNRTGLAATTWGTASVTAIAFGSAKIVVVGEFGRVATSTDGVTWTYQASLSGTTWGTSTARALSWNGTRFVVVGDLGKVATSTDGITWTYQAGLSGTAWGTAAAVNAIAWNGTTYLVVGELGKAATSTDGVTWTFQASLAAISWGTTTAFAAAWNGTTFIIVGDAGKVATTAAGTVWVGRPSLAATAWGLTTARAAVVWGSTKFLIVGDQGKAATSTDGITWVYQAGLSSTTWGVDEAYALATNGTTIVAAGAHGKIATTADGATWTYQPGLVNTTWSNAGANYIDGITSWGGNANRIGRFTFTVSWATADLARYWWNAGGALDFSFSISPTTGTTRIVDWAALLAACGTIRLGYNTTTKTGGSGTPTTLLSTAGTGGYWVTTSVGGAHPGTSTLQYKQFDTATGYTTDYVSITTTYSGTTSSGAYPVLTVTVDFANAYASTFQQTVGAAPRVTCLIQNPSNSALGIVPTTPTVSAVFTDI